MDAVLTLPIKPWMRDAGLIAVMKALGPGKALLVGGCVRGAVLGETGGDIDIATVHTPDEVMALLDKAKIKNIPTGYDHGTITAIVDKKTFEITTLRRDVKTDGRRAKVAFTTDWAVDAERRDFTMNTLLMDLNGQVFDPIGTGVADLKAGIVRFVGDPDKRIAEDVLRILRFFRFHARYGKGRPDMAGLKAALRASDRIATLSQERVTQEFQKILLADGAGAVLEWMRDYDFMPGLIPDGFDQKTFVYLQKLVANDVPGADKKLLFAYSVWENEADRLSDKIEKFFVIPNDLKKYLINNIQYLNQATDSLQKNIFLFGKEITLSGTILWSIFKEKKRDATTLKALLKKIEKLPIPKLPVNGDDIAQLTGLVSGRELGHMLRKVETWWLEQGARPNRRACLDYAIEQMKLES